MDNDRPVPLPVNPDGIPDELKTYHGKPLLRWVVWRYTFDGDEWHKVPYRTSQPDKPAASNRPGEWSTFDAALAVVKAGKADGVGFVLGRLDDGTYISGYDLDHYIAGDTIDAAAVPLIDSWHSYQERSPSGTGIKGLCRSTSPLVTAPYIGKDEHGIGVELYSWGRFFYLTGQRYGDYDSLTSAPVDDGVAALFIAEVESRKASNAAAKAAARPASNNAARIRAARQTAAPATLNGRHHSYINAAVEREAQAVADAPAGTRHNQLRSSAQNIVGLAAAAGIDPQPALEVLGDASTLPEAEMQQVLSWASEKPYNRTLPELPDTDAKSDVRRLLERIRERGYELSFNVLDHYPYVNGVMMDDPTEARIRLELYADGFKNRSLINDALLASAAQHPYHPIWEWLRGLPAWDGGDHIGELAECLLHTEPACIDTDGERRSWAELLLRHWFAGATERIKSGAQHPMLVLAGEQGIGKDSFAQFLCSDLPQYYTSDVIRPDNNDCRSRLCENLVWTPDELERMTGKHDQAALKSFLTLEQVTIRKPYGRHDIVRPALASFIGSVNPLTGFLNDPTGSRRYNVITLTGIDWSYRQRIDIRQVWAHALALHTDGLRGMLGGDAVTARNEANAAHEVENALTDFIGRYFHTGINADGATMTMSEIIEALDRRGVRLPADPNYAATLIGKAISPFKLEVKQPRRADGTRPRVYVGLRAKELAFNEQV